MSTPPRICSILSASLCAYDITQEAKGNGVKHSRFAVKVGFTDANPAVYIAGPEDIDACYVAETEDTIILAFRGTFAKLNSVDEDIKTALDWLNDLEAIPVEEEGIPGKVHKGFQDSVNGLWEKGLPEEITSRMASGKPLVITGHSKGGALAFLAAARLHKRAGIEPEKMIIRTFEAPRLGDQTFADYFNQTFPTALRYEYQHDIVPHVPPIKQVSEILARIPKIRTLLKVGSWDYKPVGTLKYINRNKKIETEKSNTWGLFALFLQRIVMLIVTSFYNPEKLIRDHSPGGNFYDVLCQEPYPKETKD